MARTHHCTKSRKGRTGALKHRQNRAGAETIEFIEADLNSDLAWDRAVAGADYVLHIASPAPAVAPKSDDELVRPTRDGALRAFASY